MACVGQPTYWEWENKDDLHREEFQGKKQFYLNKIIMINLSLSWTCYKDRVSFLVKFTLNKNNFILILR